MCGFKAPRHRDVSNKSELKGGKCKWLMYFRHLCFHNSFYHDLKRVTNNDKFYFLNGALSPKQERDPEGNFSLGFNKLPQLVWRMRKRKWGGSVAGQVSKTQTCTELIRGELQYFSPWTVFSHVIVSTWPTGQQSLTLVKYRPRRNRKQSPTLCDYMRIRPRAREEIWKKQRRESQNNSTRTLTGDWRKRPG